MSMRRSQTTAPPEAPPIDRPVDISQLSLPGVRGGITCCAAGHREPSKTPILFVGTEEGKICMYDVVFDGRRHYDLAPDWEQRLYEALTKREAGRDTPPPQLRESIKCLASRKAIQQMAVDSASQLLMVLSDGTVSMYSWGNQQLDMLHQPLADKRVVLRNVTTFCISSHRDKHRLCACVKKAVHLFQYKRSGFTPLEDDAAEAAKVEGERMSTILCVTWVGPLLVMASKEEYRLVNTETCLEVTPPSRLEHRLPKHNPICLPVPGHDEVVLLMNKEAVFYDAQGDTTRSPVRWPDEPKENPQRMQYIGSNYLVLVFTESIVMLTMPAERSQDVVRTVKMRRSVGRLVSFSAADELAFWCTATDLYCTSVVPYHLHLLSLVKASPHALPLAESLLERTFTSQGDELQRRRAHLVREAGFMYFDMGQFEEAFQQFERAHSIIPDSIDARELLNLFAFHSSLRNYMEGVRHTKHRRNVREILQHHENPAEKRTVAKRCLYHYLQAVSTDVVDDIEEDDSRMQEMRASHTALLLLYLELYPSNSEEADREIWALIPKLHLEYDVCAKELERAGKYRCLALLKARNYMISEALEMLHDIGTGGGKYKEEGLSCVYETTLVLQMCQDQEGVDLVMKYFPWILEKDPDTAIQALLVPREIPLNPDVIMTMLELCPLDIRLQYLQFLIYNEGNREGKFHTQYALTLIEIILQLLPLSNLAGQSSIHSGGSEAGLLGERRRDLQYFLGWSRRYNATEVLAHLHGKLHEEIVLVYAFTGEHQAALKVLLYDQRNFEAAREYCLVQFRKALRFHLAAYLGKREDTMAASPTSATRRNFSPIARGRRRTHVEHDDADDADADHARSYKHIDEDDFMNSAKSLGDDDDEESNQQDLLNQAMKRPNEFFAQHKIPIRDKAGNVFVGVRKHNTYLLELLSQCLYPDKGEASTRHSLMDECFIILKHHARELDPLEVLRLLPEDMPVSSCKQYLRQVFELMVCKSHQEAIQKNVAEANLHKHKVDRAVLLRRSVLIDSGRLCDVCNKPMGTDYAAVFPNMTVVHFVCMKSRQLCPKTGEPFWVDMDKVYKRSF